MFLSIKQKVTYLISFILLLLLMTGAPYFVIQYIEDHVRGDILSSMKTVNKTAEQSINIWINEEKSVIKSWGTNSTMLHSYVETLLQSAEMGLINHSTIKQVRDYIGPFIQNKGYMGFSVISPENTIIASLHDDSVGLNSPLLNHDNILERAFSGETIMTLPRTSDVPIYNTEGDLKTGVLAMFIVTPIYNRQNKIISLLSFTIDPYQKFTRLLQLGRIGSSGETYAINHSAMLISESRFDQQLQEIGLINPGQTGILNISIRNPGYNLLTDPDRIRDYDPMRAPLTFMAESATSGISNHNMDGYRDYRGVPVIGVWRWNKELDFAIATEIDVDDAFYTLHAIKFAIISGAALNFILIVALIIKFIQHNNVIKRQSLEDGLTGLSNRRMLDIKMNLAFSTSLRNRQPLAVCMIDIDHFKLFNDKLGHLAGDDALRAVAQSIKSAVKRKSDLVARYGGEEFCVILHNATLETAFTMAEKIRQSVVDLKIPRHESDDHPWVTISLGISTLRKEADTCAQNIIARADKALYVAKSEGRNCVRAYVDD